MGSDSERASTTTREMNARGTDALRRALQQLAGCFHTITPS